MSVQDIHHLAERVGHDLVQANMRMVTAESCTGGWVACAVTAVAGSSEWFERGFVTYTNTSKQEMLGVAAATLDQFGAVSEQTVGEMARGALQHSHAQVAVAISGIAGPDGGSAEKPVGTVWLAWASGEQLQTQKALFSGDREQVREQAVQTALQGIIDIIAADG